MTIGFGWGPFGAFDFGEAEWGKRVTFGALPYRWQQEDTFNENTLRDFVDAYQRELTTLQRFARALPLQRDPLKAVAVNVWVDAPLMTAQIVDDEVWGPSVLVEVQFGADISKIGPGWTVLYPATAGDRPYTVVRVRTRNDTGMAGDTMNQIWLSGPTTDFEIDTPPLTLRFYQPSMLGHLAKDFDVIIDDQEPERFQRSAVSNAVKLWSIKSNAKSYSIRGDMAGFDVRAEGLWKVADLPLNFNSASLIEIPAGSGNYFSTFLPSHLLFDEIPLDIQYDDEGEGVVGFLDHHIMFPDESNDQMNAPMAYAVNVLWGFFAGLPIVDPNNEPYVVLTGVTLLAAPAILTQFRINAASTFMLTITPAQRAKIGYMTAGAFSLVHRITREEYIVEGEISYNPGTGEWDLLTSGGTGNPPTLGQYEVKYGGARQQASCGWCRTNSLLIQSEASDQLIDEFDGDGELLNAAYERMLDKLFPLVPIHVRRVILIERLTVRIAMNITATLGVT